MRTGTAAPRWLGTDGRGRSKGSLSSSGTPASAAAPKREMVGHHWVPNIGVVQRRSLPQRVSGVLNRKLGPVGWVALVSRGVSLCEVAAEWTPRPAVGRDMVEEQEQHMAPGRNAEKPCPNRNLPCQVERRRGCFRQAFCQVGLVDVNGGEFAARLVRRQDFLERYTVVLRKNRAETFMPRQHIGECGLNSLVVKGSLDAPSHRHVVGGGWTFHSV